MGIFIIVEFEFNSQEQWLRSPRARCKELIRQNPSNRRRKSRKEPEDTVSNR